MDYTENQLDTFVIPLTNFDAPVFLKHHGVKGQRWGVKRTPEQLGHPQRTKAQIKRDKKRDKELAKLRKRQKIEKREQQAKAAKSFKFRREKAEILRSPAKMLQYRDYLTDEEIEKALKRFEMEKKLADFTRSERKRGGEFVKDVVDFTETSVKGYNMFADIYNSLKGEEGKKLKTITLTGGKKDKDDKKDKDKDEKKDDD